MAITTITAATIAAETVMMIAIVKANSAIATNITIIIVAAIDAMVTIIIAAIDIMFTTVAAITKIEIIIIINKMVTIMYLHYFAAATKVKYFINL